VSSKFHDGSPDDVARSPQVDVLVELLRLLAQVVDLGHPPEYYVVSCPPPVPVDVNPLAALPTETPFAHKPPV